MRVEPERVETIIVKKKDIYILKKKVGNPAFIFRVKPMKLKFAKHP